MADRLPAEIPSAGRLLTQAEFHRLADVPPEVEWFGKRRGGDIWRRRPGCDPDAVWMRSRQSWGPKMGTPPVRTA